MQERIDNLESLVKRLIAQNQEVAPNHAASSKEILVATAAVSDASDVVCHSGSTVIDGGHSVYKVADDWHDVLHEVRSISHFPSVLVFFLSVSVPNV